MTPSTSKNHCAAQKMDCTRSVMVQISKNHVKSLPKSHLKRNQHNQDITFGHQKNKDSILPN